MVKGRKKAVDLTDLAEEIVKLGIVLDAPKEERKEVKISLDKSQDQFTVRIPSGIAKALEIDPKKDTFEFVLRMNNDAKLELKGGLKKG